MRRGALSVVMIGLGVLCVAYVWMRIDLLRVGYEIEALEKKKASLERQHESLRFQMLQLSTPQRVAKEATKRLGLHIPEPGQIVMVTLEPPGDANDSPEERPVQFARKSDDLR